MLCLGLHFTHNLLTRLSFVMSGIYGMEHRREGLPPSTGKEVPMQQLDACESSSRATEMFEVEASPVATAPMLLRSRTRVRRRRRKRGWGASWIQSLLVLTA
jgi:hypothetical protein